MIPLSWLQCLEFFHLLMPGAQSIAEPNAGDLGATLECDPAALPGAGPSSNPPAGPGAVPDQTRQFHLVLSIVAM